MKPTLPELFEVVSNEAARLMLEEKLSPEEAFERAVPQSFRQVAEDENLLLSDFEKLVWKLLNEIQGGDKNKSVGTGQIVKRFQLMGYPGADKDSFRFKVLRAGLEPLKKRTLVRQPDKKSWAIDCRPDESEQGKRLEAASD